MEYGSIGREIQIEASPEVVFEVLSSPAHIREWWNVETDLAPTPGATGELAWGDESNPGWDIAQLEAEYHQHIIGWGRCIGRLADYLSRLVSSS